MEVAGFVIEALWVWLQSGPKVATDEQLQEQSMCLIYSSLQKYNKYL